MRYGISSHDMTVEKLLTRTEIGKQEIGVTTSIALDNAGNYNHHVSKLSYYRFHHHIS